MISHGLLKMLLVKSQSNRSILSLWAPTHLLQDTVSRLLFVSYMSTITKKKSLEDVLDMSKRNISPGPALENKSIGWCAWILWNKQEVGLFSGHVIWHFILMPYLLERLLDRNRALPTSTRNINVVISSGHFKKRLELIHRRDVFVFVYVHAVRRLCYHTTFLSSLRLLTIM